MRKNLEGLVLSPDHVYTFHIWQHLIDFSTYKLSVGSFVNIDLAAVLNGQPLQLTVIDTQVGPCCKGVSALRLLYLRVWAGLCSLQSNDMGSRAEDRRCC